MELADFTVTAKRFALQENLSDERGDGLDGIRHGVDSCQQQICVRQARMNALTNGPYLGIPRQGREGLDRVLGNHLVELAHQPLVGTEHDGADHTPIGFTLAR